MKWMVMTTLCRVLFIQNGIYLHRFNKKISISIRNRLTAYCRGQGDYQNGPRKASSERGKSSLSFKPQN